MSSKLEERIDDLFAAIDAKDSAGMAEYLTSDASFRFASAEVVHGRDAIEAAVSGFFSSIASLAHRLTKTLRSGDTLFCEGEVTYTRHDGSTLTVPFADVFELEDESISQYKIYIDIAALYT